MILQRARPSQANPLPISQRLRILFLAPFAPRLDGSHGGSRVIARLIAQLSQKHSIALCYLRADGEPGIDAVLKRQCHVVEEVVLQKQEAADTTAGLNRLRVWIELVMGKPLWAIDRWSPLYGDRVKRLLTHWRPDLIQIEFHIMGQYLQALAGYAAPRILVQHEPGLESVRESVASEFSSGRLIPWLDLMAWTQFERKVIQQVQAVVVFTERDRESISIFGTATPIVRIPLGAETLHRTPNKSEDPLSLLFIGNFKHLPNVDAADRLINGIFPRVRSQIPAARLVIVGDHLPSNIVRTSDENVTRTGFVPDIVPYLDRAALVVAPIRFGGGMRVKVLEALAAGKALIASSRAVQGLDVIDGEHFILAEEDEDFIRAIIGLLNDPDRRKLLEVRAHAWARRNLSWEKTGLAYETLYQQLLSEHGLLMRGV